MTALRRTRESRAGLTSWPFTPIEELDLYLESAADPSLIQLETLVRGHLDAAALESALAAALAADPAARRHLAATSRWRRRLRWETGARHPGRAVSAALHRDRAGDSPGPARRAAGMGVRLADPAARSRGPADPGDRARARCRDPADPPRRVRRHLQPCPAHRDRRRLPGTRAATSRAPARRPSRCPRPGPARNRRPGQDQPWRWTGTLARAGLRPRRPGSRRLPGVVTRIAARTGAPDRPGYGSVQRSMPVPRPARQGSGPFPTVNDLLVAALIRTVDRWNAAQGRHSGRIRISVPVNDRDRQGRWAGPREPDPADPGHRG